VRTSTFSDAGVVVEDFLHRLFLIRRPNSNVMLKVMRQRTA